MQMPDPSREAGNFSVRSFLTFVFVGGFATGLHYAIILFTVYALGWSLVYGSTLGFSLSAVVNYLLNVKLTFRSTQSHKNTAPRFFLVAGSGLVLNYGILSILLSLDAHAVIAQILTTIGVLIWNYIVSGLWTFRQQTT
ncbi:GtrA family protein [Massilia sp. S19_KUP03_FR1]|uniref:GtrA family protein n=1 Tax=Massilia sp. S19_KUP03_FR1 TaxID=3025503 RepID=UPI002FCDD3BE